VIGTVATRVREEVRIRSSHGRTAAGTPLPPLAYRMGGRHFRQDRDFEAAARSEVRKLESFGLGPTSRILDWGCGAGRLAVGIQDRFGRLDQYHGVDVQRPLIEWARRHLRREGFEFSHVDIANGRYNPNGLPETYIPGVDSDYDFFYAFSVFSHMGRSEAEPYLAEIFRLLRNDGVAYFTAFVEQGVAAEAENPTGYGPMKWAGPLHCVRYEETYFEDMLKGAGFVIEHHGHATEADGQSLYITRRRQ
jgi:SAM-dependent methyltransferase